MAYKYAPARRSKSQCLIGLYGQSGGGKTYGALLMGRGIIGPDGKLGLADSEGGRGELFADVPEIGGYTYTQLSEPFTPASYIEAIGDAEKQGVDCLVIDSMSHEWEGIGGVLHMAAANEERTKKAGLHNWKKPKEAHQYLLLKILGTKMHIICCLRAKRKSHQGVKDGKTVVVKDLFYSPKMDDEFISEMLAYAEILGKDDVRGPKHQLIVGKATHPAVATFFKTGTMITIKMGEQFRAWSDGKIKAPDAATMAGQREQEEQEYKRRLAAQAPKDEAAGGGAPASDDPPPFAPEGGWPELKRLSEWGTWSTDTFLPKATRPMVEAWESWWSGYLDALRERVDAKHQAAVDLEAKLKKLIAEAMKREPKK